MDQQSNPCTWKEEEYDTDFKARMRFRTMLFVEKSISAAPLAGSELQTRFGRKKHLQW